MTRSLSSMRKLTTPTTTTTSTSFSRWRSFVLNNTRHLFEHEPALSLRTLPPSRSLAQVRRELPSESWFTPSRPIRSPADDLLGDHGRPGSNGDHKPPDEQTLKLGKTLRTLSPLLPNILSQPVPSTILSPSISLHLFPSTHPYLPAVKGRVPYRAALWTAPVAWGCVPLVGNVKLQILSEKIVRTGDTSYLQSSNESRPKVGDEKLVVRWKTEKRKPNPTSSNSTTTSSTTPFSNSTSTPLNRTLSALLGGSQPIFNLTQGDEFSGLFIFTFDSEGRIATHTIEHADECHGTDKTSRVVTLTDWLLGRAKWRGKEEGEMIPGLAVTLRVCREEWERGSEGLADAGRPGGVGGGVCTMMDR